MICSHPDPLPAGARASLDLAAERPPGAGGAIDTAFPMDTKPIDVDPASDSIVVPMPALDIRFADGFEATED